MHSYISCGFSADILLIDHNRPVLVLGPNHRADVDIYMQKLPSLLYPKTSDCTAQLSATWYRDLRGPEVWHDDWCVSSLAPSPLHLRHLARPPYRHPDTAISASLATLLLTHGQLFLSILANWFCSHLLKGLLLPQSPVLWFLRVSPFLSLLSPSYSWQILQDFEGKCWHLQTSWGTQDSAFFSCKE